MSELTQEQLSSLAAQYSFVDCNSGLNALEIILQAAYALGIAAERERAARERAVSDDYRTGWIAAIESLERTQDYLTKNFK